MTLVCAIDRELQTIPDIWQRYARAAKLCHNPTIYNQFGQATTEELRAQLDAFLDGLAESLFDVNEVYMGHVHQGSEL